MENKKILIAEDERPISKVLKLKLERYGYDVEAVFNGEEVLLSLEKGKYDLVILDMMMPKVNGFEVLQKLKELKNNVPVIVMSNLGQTEDVKRGKELGAFHYFVKSDTSLAVIAEAIQKILSK